MGSLERKLRRMEEKQKQKYLNDVKEEAQRVAHIAILKAGERGYDEGYKDAVENSTTKVLAVACEVVYNHWRELTKKDTRLSVFVELMRKKLEQIDEPTESQKEVEKLLEEQCNMKVVRIEQ